MIFEEMSTPAVATAIQNPFSTEVVIASVGHSPKRVTKMGLFLMTPLVNSVHNEGELVRIYQLPIPLTYRTYELKFRITIQEFPFYKIAAPLSSRIAAARSRTRSVQPRCLGCRRARFSSPPFSISR